MTYYTKLDADERRMVTTVLEEWHPHLAEANVTFDLLFHHPKTDENGHPVPDSGLKHNGYGAAGVTKIVGVKDRAKGCADVEIVFDLATWETMDDEQREALIDHELTHVQVVTDERGDVESDAVGRPRLRTRRHDYQHGWFAEVAERRGMASLEVQQAVGLVKSEHGQLFLPGIVGDASSAAARTAVAPLKRMARDLAKKGRRISIKAGDGDYVDVPPR